MRILVMQEALKSMRKNDDIIISTINAMVPTDSFHADGSAACKNIYDEIQKGHNVRENLIRNCITHTTNSMKKLKHERDNLNDIEIKKTLRTEQTKLRMLQVELSVEDLIKERSIKVFNEKCRRFYKAPHP